MRDTPHDPPGKNGKDQILKRGRLSKSVYGQVYSVEIPRYAVDINLVAQEVSHSVAFGLSGHAQNRRSIHVIEYVQQKRAKKPSMTCLPSMDTCRISVESNRTSTAGESKRNCIIIL
jgi:hypothetical protein